MYYANIIIFISFLQLNKLHLIELSTIYWVIILLTFIQIHKHLYGIPILSHYLNHFIKSSCSIKLCANTFRLFLFQNHEIFYCLAVFFCFCFCSSLCFSNSLQQTTDTYWPVSCTAFVAQISDKIALEHLVRAGEIESELIHTNIAHTKNLNTYNIYLLSTEDRC